MDVLEWTPNCPPPQSAENDLPWSQPLLPKSLGTLLWWILHSPWCVSSQCQGRVRKKHCCGAWATGAQGMVPKPHVSLLLGGHHQGAWSHFKVAGIELPQPIHVCRKWAVEQTSCCVWSSVPGAEDIEVNREDDAYPSGSHLPGGLRTPVAVSMHDHTGPTRR